MAADSDTPQGMTRDHQSGYDGFIAMMKWGAVLSFIIAMLVMYMIA